MRSARIILGSRSPQRRELLSLLVPSSQIEIQPPRDAEELGFEQLTTWLEIAHRLQRIARTKNDDVCQQLSRKTPKAGDALVMVRTADTAIVRADAMAGLHYLAPP